MNETKDSKLLTAMVVDMENWESQLVKTQLDTIASLPVHYDDNYEQPPSNFLRKVPVFPIPLPEPPKRVRAKKGANDGSTPLNLTFKSTKPSISYTLIVSPTDTIAAIKALIHSAPTNGPPPDVQRLLFKGKALNDSKLLREYESIKNGDTINLMVKPGYVWESSTSAPLAPPPTSTTGGGGGGGGHTRSKPSLTLSGPAGESAVPMEGVEPRVTRSRSHSRTSSINIPDLTLSPTPGTLTPRHASGSVPLTLDTSIASGSSSSPSHHARSSSMTSYTLTLSNPNFWTHLYGFLGHEFDHQSDAALAFEDFLLASKAHLTAGQIAMIRDKVGVLGMSGT